VNDREALLRHPLRARLAPVLKAMVNAEDSEGK
jgi:hypothetical protein